MNEYKTIDELIEASAQQSHRSNLTVGGVFDENGNRISNLENERLIAKSQVRFEPYPFRMKTINHVGFVKIK